MLVQAFDCPAERKSDFVPFVNAMHARSIAPDLYRVDRIASPCLFLAWCLGDCSYRSHDLRKKRRLTFSAPFPFASTSTAFRPFARLQVAVRADQTKQEPAAPYLRDCALLSPGAEHWFLPTIARAPCDPGSN